MTNKRTVKVVKKGASPEPKNTHANEKVERRRAAMDIVNNVSSWVMEVRDRKAQETRNAIDLLLGTRTSVTES
ncbi:MAG: hypothetical protein KF736_13105 [Acidobacteria bacterium]|nr:hypothetical protein [Acidobacteriota bacterium]MCW5950353.1 hypothetical protein [Pyrinomonadaceae bacterium]